MKMNIFSNNSVIIHFVNHEYTNKFHHLKRLSYKIRIKCIKERMKEKNFKMKKRNCYGNLVRQ